MKKIGQIGLTVVAVFLVGACNQGLFGTNVFAGFEGEYKLPNVETADSQDIVKAAKDDRFYEKVENLAPEKVKKMVETLKATTDDPEVDQVDRKKAALTAGEVEIRSGGVKKGVGKFNDLITKLVVEKINEGDKKDEDPGDDKDLPIDLSKPGEVVKRLFEKDATLEEVRKKLEGLSKAADHFKTYGKLLKEDEKEGREAETPAGFNSGDVASTALLAGTVEALLEETKEQGTSDDEEAIEELAQAIVSSLAKKPDAPDPLTEKYKDFGNGKLRDILGDDIYTAVNNGLDLEVLGLGAE